MGRAIDKKTSLNQSDKVRTSRPKAVKHGYVEYSGTRVNHTVLNPRLVVDVLSLNHGSKPHRPILFQAHRHYALVGRADQIIKMQIALIREGSPFQVIGLRASDTHERQYDHCNIFFDLDHAKPALNVRDSLARSFCWLLGPASPGAISAVSADTFHSVGAISHATEKTVHSSFQIIESTHHGLFLFQRAKTKAFSLEDKISYHLDRVEKWILSGSTSSGHRLAGRKKIKIDIGCEIAATNKKTEPYDSVKRSSKHSPLDISTELLCLSIYFVATGRKPTKPFTKSFLDAVKVYVCTEELPDHLELRDYVKKIRVMKETENECYLASVLEFFHKTRAVEPLTLSKRWELLREEMKLDTRYRVNDYLFRSDPAESKMCKYVSINALSGVGEMMGGLTDQKYTLQEFIESTIQSQLQELKLYVKTGELSEALQARVDESVCADAHLTDNVNDSYQKACEFLYYMKHDELPSDLSYEQLTAFEKFTKTGIVPKFFASPERERTVRVSNV